MEAGGDEKKELNRHDAEELLMAINSRRFFYVLMAIYYCIRYNTALFGLSRRRHILAPR